MRVFPGELPKKSPRKNSAKNFRKPLTLSERSV